MSLSVGVAELADASDLGSDVSDVGVQVPSSAPFTPCIYDKIAIMRFYASGSSRTLRLGYPRRVKIEEQQNMRVWRNWQTR